MEYMLTGQHKFLLVEGINVFANIQMDRWPSWLRRETQVQTCLITEYILIGQPASVRIRLCSYIFWPFCALWHDRLLLPTSSYSILCSSVAHEQLSGRPRPIKYHCLVIRPPLSNAGQRRKGIILPADPPLCAGGDFTMMRFVPIWNQVYRRTMLLMLAFM